MDDTCVLKLKLIEIQMQLREKRKTDLLVQFDKRLGRMENQLEKILDQGEETKELSRNTNEQVKDNKGMLEQLSVTFRKRIKRQQFLLSIAMLFIVILLFWIVTKVT